MNDKATGVIDHGLVFYAPQDVRYQQVAVNEPGDGQVLVEVEACAICGTDFKAWKKGNPRLRPPITMGHEFCGRIIALGEGVKACVIGQRVTMATTIGCGSCVYCAAGRTNLCRSAEAMGFAHPGAMASRVIIPAAAVRQGHLVDVGDLAAPIATLAEPLSCVINGLSKVPAEARRTVLILGLGPLGALHALAARAFGARRIVGADPSPGRRQLAQAMPFDEVCDPGEIGQRIAPHAGGEGFDLAIVTAPAAAAMAGAIPQVRKGGYVSWFGSLPVGEHELTIDSRAVHYGELTVFGTSDSTVAHVRAAVDMLRGHESIAARMITHELPLNGFEQAMQLIERGAALKIVLRP